MGIWWMAIERHKAALGTPRLSLLYEQDLGRGGVAEFRTFQLMVPKELRDIFAMATAQKFCRLLADREQMVEGLLLSLGASCAESRGVFASPCVLRTAARTPVSPAVDLGQEHLIAFASEAGEEGREVREFPVGASHFKLCAKYTPVSSRKLFSPSAGEQVFFNTYLGYPVCVGKRRALSATLFEWVHTWRELRSQRVLGKHVNISTLEDASYDATEGCVYLFTQAYWHTLGSFLRGGGRLNEQQVQELLFQALCGLRFMHNNGAVHRNLAPDCLVSLHVILAFHSPLPPSPPDSGNLGLLFSALFTPPTLFATAPFEQRAAAVTCHYKPEHCARLGAALCHRHSICCVFHQRHGAWQELMLLCTRAAPGWCLHSCSGCLEPGLHSCRNVDAQSVSAFCLRAIFFHWGAQHAHQRYCQAVCAAGDP